MKSLQLMRFVVPLFFLITSAVATQTDTLDRFWTAGHVHHLDGKATVVSEDPRPLWMALNSLEREYGWVIDYEDPIYDTARESATVHNAQWEAIHPGTMSRVPAGGTFTTSYSEDSNNRISPASRAPILKQLVRDYNASNNPGRFEVHQDAKGRVSIVGFSKYSGANQTSILDAVITLPAGVKDTLTALNEFTTVLSQTTKIPVVLGTIPWTLLSQAHVNISSNPGPARAILTDIADSAQITLMWDFLYDIDSHSYFLSLRPRSKIQSDVGSAHP